MSCIPSVNSLTDGSSDIQAPGRGPLSAGSGAVGPRGYWNFYVKYWVWGYGDLAGDDVLEAFVRVWDSWRWIDSTEPRTAMIRTAYGHTPDKYRFDMSRGVHGGVGMSWMSPYFPASGSDYGGAMPWIITKDGPQSYEQPRRG